MKNKEKLFSHIKSSKVTKRFVEKGQILTCLNCKDVFFSQDFKLHNCGRHNNCKNNVFLTVEEKRIFEDPLKLERFLDLKPVVNYIWKRSKYSIKQPRERKRSKGS